MKTRKKIHSEMQKKRNQIAKLKNEIIELYKEDCLLSDKTQWYTEIEEEVTISRRPLVKEKVLFGYINWIQGFKDEDTGKIIKIERKQRVKRNGEWI